MDMSHDEQGNTIDEALLTRFDDVMRLASNNHPLQQQLLSRYAVLKTEKFWRYGRMADLEEAIQKGLQAVAGTPEEDVEFTDRLNILGVMLASHFERTGRQGDLEEAIRIARRAVEVTPQDHPNLAAWLNNLGNRLESRFERTGRMEDLEEAIRTARRAVEATPQDHPDLAAWLNNLGSELERRFERTGRMEDLEDQPPNIFLQSWNCTNSMPFHRVSAALQAIRLLKRRADLVEAAEVAKQVVRFLPLVNNRSLSRDDQQHVVSRFSGVAPDVCSLVLHTGGDGFEVLELLELGRGVIISLLMDDRSDISKLESSFPEEAATYDRLRNEVNAPVSEVADLALRSIRMTRRLEAVKELDERIHSIRELPGHRRFLLGPTLEELKSWASEGPIVVVNITDVRSDAIVVTTSGVESVELQDLTLVETIKWVQEGLTIYDKNDTPRDRGKKNKRYLEFLQWLWLKCVRVILQAIHHGQNPGANNLPRLWWIGVGIATYLPFHAAGDHSVGSTENTLSWAISSYTPTIKALAHARERQRKRPRFVEDKLKLLLVAMPTTPDQSGLPGVRKETLEVRAAVNSVFADELLVHPNARTVLEKLRQCDMAHFACHTISDHADPFSSCLVLQDGINTAPTVDKLTVRQISEANLERAAIAYLSACSTAENRAVGLADEVIHLASGFQVAGFSHVVASMWSSDDEICVEMAKGFYQRLKSAYDGQRTDRDVAAAVHDSILEIRSKWRKQPLSWAPYIHLGA